MGRCVTTITAQMEELKYHHYMYPTFKYAVYIGGLNFVKIKEWCVSKWGNKVSFTSRYSYNRNSDSTCCVSMDRNSYLENVVYFVNERDANWFMLYWNVQ